MKKNIFATLLIFCSVSMQLLGQIYYSIGDEQGVLYFDLDSQTSSTIVDDTHRRHRAFCLDVENMELITASGIYSSEGKLIGNNPSSYNSAKDIAINEVSGDVYYCKGMSIYKGTNDIFTGFFEIRSIALDISKDLIYFTDDNGQTISLLNISSGELSTIHQSTSGLSDIQTLELSPNGEELIFSDFGNGKIQKIETDGTQLTTLVDNVDRPISLTFDRLNDNLYWTQKDSTKIFFLKGQEIREIGLSKVPAKIQTDKNGLIYWSSNDNSSIGRYNVFSGEHEYLIASVIGGEYALAADAINQKLVISYNGSVNISELDGSRMKALNFGLDWAGWDTKNLALDPLRERVYFMGESNYVSDLEPYGIGLHSKKYDGTDLKFLKEGYLREFYLDIYDSNFYFLNGGELLKSDLDAQNPESILQSISAYTIDKVNERIYYSKGDFISYSDLSGENETMIISGNAEVLEVDHELGRLYFIENGFLKYTDLEGMFETILISPISSDQSDRLYSFSLSNSNGAYLLPIINSDATIVGNSVNLSWTLDDNFSGFQPNSVPTGDFLIQKKTLSNDWVELGDVQYFEGIKDYSFVDNDAELGPNYYRLKYISDVMNLNSYSRTFMVDFITTATIESDHLTKVWNTPDNILNIKEFNGEMKIIGPSGELVHGLTTIKADTSVSINQLGRGVYYVRLISLDGKVTVVPIYVI